MRDSRSDLERNIAALPADEAWAARQEAVELPVIDLTYLPAVPRPAPVQDPQRWLDLCG